MEQINQADWYKLLNEGMRINGFDSVNAFFREQFNENVFPQAKWKKLFRVAEENFTGGYTQLIGNHRVPIIANSVVRDVRGNIITNKELYLDTDNMPTMKLTLDFSEKEIIGAEYILSRGGIPEYERVFNSFKNDASNIIAGIHAQRLYTGLQVESTGKRIVTIKNNDSNITEIMIDFSVNAPKANRRKCGGFGKHGKKFAWCDDRANPIGDLRDMWEYYRRTFHIPNTAVFRMNDATFDMLANHPTTLIQVAVWKTNGTINTENLQNYIVTLEDVNEYLSSRLRLPKISVEDWFGVVQSINPKTNKAVDTPLVGFADNTVLLRPDGYVGELQWQAPTTIFSTQDNPIYMSDGGKIGITLSARRTMTFTAEFTGMAVPENIDRFLYLDTSVM